MPSNSPLHQLLWSSVGATLHFPLMMGQWRKKKNKIACPPARLYTICHGIFLFSHCVLVRATNTWMGFIWAADLQVCSKTRRDQDDDHQPFHSYITHYYYYHLSRHTAQEAPKYPWESSLVGHNSKITLLLDWSSLERGNCKTPQVKKKKKWSGICEKIIVTVLNRIILGTDRNLLVTVHVFYKPLRQTTEIHFF